MKVCPKFITPIFLYIAEVLFLAFYSHRLNSNASSFCWGLMIMLGIIIYIFYSKFDYYYQEPLDVSTIFKGFQYHVYDYDMNNYFVKEVDKPITTQKEEEVKKEENVVEDVKKEIDQQ
jgi:hypothetical protein